MAAGCRSCVMDDDGAAVESWGVRECGQDEESKGSGGLGTDRKVLAGAVEGWEGGRVEECPKESMLMNSTSQQSGEVCAHGTGDERHEHERARLQSWLGMRQGAGRLVSHGFGGEGETGNGKQVTLHSQSVWL